MATLQQNLQRPFYIKHLLERLRYGKAATAMRREAAELIEKMNEDSSNLSAQNSAQAMRIDELQAEIGRLRLDAATWWKRVSDLEEDLAAANARVEELKKALIASKISHTVVEDDCWYSCPKSGKCCNENNKPHDYCNCGADEHNARIDAAIAASKEGQAWCK